MGDAWACDLMMSCMHFETVGGTEAFQRHIVARSAGLGSRSADNGASGDEQRAVVTMAAREDDQMPGRVLGADEKEIAVGDRATVRVL